MNPDKLRITPCGQEYAGGIRKNLIKVYAHPDVMAIYTKYGFDLEVTWRFNREGRIITLDTRVRDEMEKPLIDVGTQPSLHWKTAKASYDQMPCQTENLNTGFQYMELRKQYEALLRFGHGTATKILAELRADAIGEVIDIRPSQRQLSEIVKNQEAMGILANISTGMPRVQMADNHLIITY